MTSRVEPHEMALHGYCVEWCERKEVLDLVRKQTKSALGKAGA